MQNIEFIPKDQFLTCWACEDTKNKNCKFCNGTRKFREDQYYLIYKDKRGQKICFNVDGLK